MKRTFLPFFFAFVVCLSFCGGIDKAAAEEEKTLGQKTLKRRVDPVELTGELLPGLCGKELDHLRVYALLEGKWRQVVYQFDERYPNLNVYFNVGVDKEADADKANHLLDPQDKLVFYVREAGDQAHSNAWPEGVSAGHQLTIIDPLDQSRGWIYVFYFSNDPPPRSSKKYVDVGSLDVYGKPEMPLMARCTNFHVDGRINKVRGRYYRTAFHQTFSQPVSAGGSGENLLDRMKFRVKLRLLFGLLRIGFDETDCVGGIENFKVGPCRALGRVWMGITLPTGIKGPRMYGDTYVYDSMTLNPAVINVPINPGTLLTDFSMSIGYDMNENARGMKFYNSNNLEGFTIDGVTDEREEKMNTGHDEWRLVTGPQGTTIFRSEWDEYYAKQAERRVFFSDNSKKKDRPEDIPGKFGYFYQINRVKSLEPRQYRMQLDVYYPSHFFDPDRLPLEMVHEYINIKKHALLIICDDRKAKNTGGDPALLLPAEGDDDS